MFEITTAVQKMLVMKAEVRIVQGATYSGKTYGIIPIAVDHAIYYPKSKTTVTGVTLDSLVDGPVQIFQDFMQETGRWVRTRWNDTRKTYTFANGSRFQFKSFDKLSKAKAAGKRDFLFINEANHVEFNIADALMTRTDKVTWLDFNADNEFWAHTETMHEPNSEFLKLTYLDNEKIPETTYRKLMARRDKALLEEIAGQKGYWWNWWQVYGLGEIGSLIGVVFNNWGEVDLVPSGAKLVGTAMDLGYTNDPTTIMDVYEYQGELYWDERLYRRGMKTNDIAKFIQSEGINGLIWCDVDPRLIDELRDYGILIRATDKPEIVVGIDFIQQSKFYVTKRSKNTIKELRNYMWTTDKSGKAMNKPIDAFNHCIDPVRYIYVMRNKYRGNYGVGGL